MRPAITRLQPQLHFILNIRKCDHPSRLCHQLHLTMGGCKKMHRSGVVVFVGLVLTAFVVPAQAQTIPKSLQDAGPEAALRERKNAWTVGVAGGLLEGTRLRFVDEMARVAADGDNMRVMPFISQGSASNLEDLLYLRGVDVAVTQSDVFEFFRTQRGIPNLDKRVQYIFRFPPSETHIIARKEIQTMEDLRGKKVHFGSDGAAGTLTGPILFQRLGIEVQQVEGSMDNPTGMQKVRNGEIDAVVRVTGKPTAYVSSIPANSGLHLVPIPYSKKFTDYYALSEFTNADYPNLVAPGERVDTIGVPGVLAVYNWPKNTDRYRKVERFVGRLFANWDKLLQPPNHPKWKDINLAATVEGWTRYSVAEQELQRLKGTASGQQELGREFQAFMSQAGETPKTSPERDALFRQFLQWRDKQGGMGR
jgi:TRAP transporter TAXI family solute receptor